jgi:hypothetical protein
MKNATIKDAAASAMEKIARGDLMTLAEVAARFDVSPQTVHRMPLASIRLGRSLRFDPRDVNQLIEDSKEPALQGAYPLPAKEIPAMPKLSLIAKPSFNAVVSVPIAGGEAAEIRFTFKHRTKTDFEKWVTQERNDVDAILDVASDWDLLEPFNAESVELLVQNHISAPAAIMEAYIGELTATRAKP